MKNVTIPEFAKDCADRTRERLDTLAKLPGSLGKLEELSIRLAGITAREYPSFPNKGLVLFAADHDIVLKGASASSQEMTELQVRNFAVVEGPSMHSAAQPMPASPLWTWA